MSKPSEVAYAAARIMSEQGHCKNVLSDGEGRVCYIEALARAGSEVDFDYMNVAGISAAILRERGYRPPSFDYEESFPDDDSFLPIVYNNDHAVSGEDVIQLLKETAFRLENEGS